MNEQHGRRKYHKKSRRGCQGCKRRHVKCDELRPNCSNCLIRGVECGYGSSDESPSYSQPSQPSPENREDCLRTGSIRTELELFHHWSTDTYRSLVFDMTNDRLWQISIPKAALEQDYLLSAILALSALHISTTTPPAQSSSYQLRALRYHNLACAAFQAEDRRVTFETHQSLFAFSILNLVLAVALPSCLDQDIDQSGIFNHLSTMFSLLQGTTSIYRLARTWLLDGPFGSFVHSTNNMEMGGLDENVRIGFERLRVLRDEEYSLTSSRTETVMHAVRRYQVTTAAIEALEACFLIRYKDRMVVCFRWLALLDEEFKQWILHQEPIALIITMRWAVLLDGLSREKWWAKLTGKSLVAEVSRLLMPRKPEWIDIINAVHSEVGLPPLASH